MLGPVGFADAAAVVAMFNGINRVADMCGVIIDPFSAEIAPSVLDALQMEHDWVARLVLAPKTRRNTIGLPFLFIPTDMIGTPFKNNSRRFQNDKR